MTKKPQHNYRIWKTQAIFIKEDSLHNPAAISGSCKALKTQLSLGEYKGMGWINCPWKREGSLRLKNLGWQHCSIMHGNHRDIMGILSAENNLTTRLSLTRSYHRGKLSTLLHTFYDLRGKPGVNPWVKVTTCACHTIEVSLLPWDNAVHCALIIQTR